ncbi:MAG TPA: toxin-antitoxin system, antitoxin component [Candidatus Desulfofervidus auxilii]|uniref:Toxin-antitoxin system, antitoxin component n=1 Tax=Desulfofervidus auxilii TaxID=1621989 RepID=A0A7C0Y406_DESA2|nr:toxin-antitoxin system, antitoxin component [Candidatus Desulfofervidus auxilii]
MATKQLRVNVVFDRSLYTIIKEISQRENISMSAAVRDLVKEALELKEDIALANFAEEREKDLKEEELMSHEEVWEV